MKLVPKIFKWIKQVWRHCGTVHNLLLFINTGRITTFVSFSKGWKDTWITFINYDINISYKMSTYLKVLWSEIHRSEFRCSFFIHTNVSKWFIEVNSRNFTWFNHFIKIGIEAVRNGYPLHLSSLDCGYLCKSIFL